VYGPVRTVVWQGSVGDHRPYADRVGIADIERLRVTPQGDSNLEQKLIFDTNLFARVLSGLRPFARNSESKCYAVDRA
jgi:hypothetical protein